MYQSFSSQRVHSLLLNFDCFFFFFSVFFYYRLKKRKDKLLKILSDTNNNYQCKHLSRKQICLISKKFELLTHSQPSVSIVLFSYQSDNQQTNKTRVVGTYCLFYYYVGITRFYKVRVLRGWPFPFFLLMLPFFLAF